MIFLLRIDKFIGVKKSIYQYFFSAGTKYVYVLYLGICLSPYCILGPYITLKQLFQCFSFWSLMLKILLWILQLGISTFDTDINKIFSMF